MADRYWVGGTNNWDAINLLNWSATDGGASGATVPTTTDNVFFTAASGAVTATLTYAPSVLFINFTGFTGTFVTGANLITCTQWTAVAGMTLNATGSTITISSNNTFTTGAKTYDTVTLSVTGNMTISGSGSTTSSLTCKNTSGYVAITTPSTMNIGTLTLTGNNNTTQRISWGSQSYFTASTITVTTAATALTNVDLIGVTRSGAGTWSGTSVGNGGNNSATINFTTPKTVYWIQGASASQDFLSDANFATSSGGTPDSANFPLPQDTANFDANSFGASGKTVACSQFNVRFPSLNWTGATNNPSFTPSSPNYYGSVVLLAPGSMTYSPTGTTGFFGLGNASLTTAGQTLQAFSTMYMVGTALTYQDNVTSSGSITWNLGGLTANNVNEISTAFNSTGGSVRVLTMGSGTWELNGTGAVWNFNGAFAPNVTINPGTSTIKLTNNSASSKSVYGIGKTWGNFWNATLGAGVVIMQDSATWNNFKIDAGRTQQFVAATNTTFSSFTATGAVANLITIQSTTAATHTLTHLVTSLANRFVSCDYLSIDHSIALPTKTFYAGANSVDNGSNTGWIFTVPPASNLKTINGIPIASIKTVNSIAASAIKSVNGIT